MKCIGNAWWDGHYVGLYSHIQRGIRVSMKGRHLKVAGEYNGIPGVWLEQGKRWVATHYGWGKIRQLVFDLAKGRCSECNVQLKWFDVHHRFGRGGGKRDDRPVLPDGTVNLLCLCRDCHADAKIERRLPLEPLPVAKQEEVEYKEPA